METTRSSETSIYCKLSTPRYIPEDAVLLGILCALRVNGTPLIWNTNYGPVSARPDVLLVVTLD
jgi:hypothetical protein